MNLIALLVDCGVVDCINHPDEQDIEPSVRGVHYTHPENLEIYLLSSVEEPISYRHPTTDYQAQLISISTPAAQKPSSPSLMEKAILSNQASRLSYSQRTPYALPRS